MYTNRSKLALKMVTAILAIVLISSCHSNAPKEDIGIKEVEISTAFETIQANDESLDPKSKMPAARNNLKIIKSATVKFKVKDVKAASKLINKKVFEHDGYISDQRFQNNLYQIENRFTIKVPQKHFDTLLDSLNNVAEFIDYVNVTSQDVTEEYIDIKSRLETKIEVKKRYEDILRKQTKTVEDILTAEEKLSTIQEEIDAAKGRLKYLINKVSFSTIQVDLYEEVAYTKEPTSYTRTFISKVKEGFSFGWNLIEAITLGIIYVWPLLLIGFIVFFFIKRKK